MKNKSISIFISYHHSDEEFKNALKRHLKILTLRDKDIDIFDDSDIPVGEEWDKKIRSEIEKSDIIIMLISASFLSSNYIREVELQLALKKQNKYIVPIIVRPAMWWSIDELKYYQVLPKDGKSISEHSHQDEVLTEVTNEIAKIVDSINNQRYEIERLKEDFATGSIEKRSLDYDPEEEEEDFQDRPTIFISHSHDDGDFAELLKIKLESNRFRAWVDIDRLKIGEVWRDKIDEGIKESVALIVIMTEKARASEYVTYEWAFALGSGITVFPLKLRETPFHPRLDSLQYLDFTNREARPWQKLFDRLEEVAKKKKT